MRRRYRNEQRRASTRAALFYSHRSSGLSRFHIMNETSVVLQDESKSMTRAAKKLRVFELCLVMLVAFGYSIYASLLVFIYHIRVRSQYIDAGVYATLLKQVTALLLMGYILFRQGKSWRDIGLAPRWRDLLLAVALTITAAIFSYGTTFLLAHSFGNSALAPHNLPLGMTLVSSLLLGCINPFFEELIVRAFLITELRALTGSVLIAVLASTLLQTSYHIYQGAFVALSYLPLFLVYSLYFARTRRILPVILSHMFFDLTALLYYLHR